MFATPDPFIKQINDAVENLSDAGKLEIQRELIKLANVSELLTDSAKDSATATGETIETSFQILKDGRVIEQIRGGFAVYDADTKEYSILETVTDSDGITYLPDADALFSEGGLHVADDLTDYGDETALDADIEAYLLRYADVSILHRKMTAKYIRFTYLFDKTYELPYITATGEGGNGKTRLGELVCFASRRGLTLINPSAPSLFRIIDKYQPTLFLDESNLADTGEDTMAILQVLNSGIKKTTGLVPRQEKGADGNFQTRLYRTFAPKIVGSLKKTKSQPFNSRCIEIQMEATKRNDIPFRTTSQMLEDARQLRNKLTLYRLRNFSIDFEQKLGEAEKEMKAANLKPRTTQVNTPLLALTDDEQLKADFLLLLQESDSVRAKDKLDTMDGEIAQAIHALIFDADADGKPALRIEFENIENLEPNEHLTVEKILESLNEERSEKKKISSQWLGQLLKGLKIETKKTSQGNRQIIKNGN